MKVPHSSIQSVGIDLSQIVSVLSDALDWVGLHEPHHGKRVAFMAVQLGDALNLPKPLMEDLFLGGLIHDIGASSSRVLQELLDSEYAGDMSVHCRRGAELVSCFRPLKHLAPMILHHHTHWGDFASIEDDTAASEKLLANCIALSDRIDILLRRYPDADPLMMRDVIKKIVVTEAKEEKFMPELMDAFSVISDHEAFWFSQDIIEIGGLIGRYATERRVLDFSFEDLRDLATVLSLVIDAKSSFTALHSFGVMSLASFLGYSAGLSVQACDLLEIASLLHDVGKLRIPDEILENPGALTVQERSVIARHSFYSFHILSRIEGFEKVAMWAGNHHEYINGSGYPFHLKGEQLSTESRILTIADIFQSLSQDRPYRKAMSSVQVLSILDSMVMQGKLDGDIVHLIHENLDHCCTMMAVGLNSSQRN